MSKLSENAIKLNDKLTELKKILRPAVEAARERQNAAKGIGLDQLFAAKNDEALIKAGEVLGI